MKIIIFICLTRFDIFLYILWPFVLFFNELLAFFDWISKQLFVLFLTDF